MRSPRDLERLDAWLQRLHKEHPLLFNLLAVGLALVLFGFVLLVKWVLGF